jgi:hypothetical protein
MKESKFSVSLHVAGEEGQRVTFAVTLPSNTIPARISG